MTPKQTATKANLIRDKVREICAADPEKEKAAREAWSRVVAESRQGRQRLRLRISYARLAMLQALADGKTVKAAEDAAMEALWE